MGKFGLYYADELWPLGFLSGRVLLLRPLHGQADKAAPEHLRSSVRSRGRGEGEALGRRPSEVLQQRIQVAPLKHHDDAAGEVDEGKPTTTGRLLHGGSSPLHDPFKAFTR